MRSASSAFRARHQPVSIACDVEVVESAEQRVAAGTSVIVSVYREGRTIFQGRLS